MTVIKVTAAERRRLELDRKQAAETKAAAIAVKKEVRERAKVRKAAADVRYKEQVQKAKERHELNVATLYRAHISSLRQDTIGRLRGLMNALEFLSPSAITADPKVAGDAEVVLLRAGVDPKETFEAPEFVAPKKPEDSPPGPNWDRAVPEDRFIHEALVRKHQIQEQMMQAMQDPPFIKKTWG